MLVFNQSLINHIAEICVGAGKAILKEYEKPTANISLKADSSPVTDADLRADEFIVAQLFKLENTIPCLSEESTNNFSIANEDLFWAVDPLDGTKEFINKTGDFTVNIGLIKNKRPIFGIIYAPVFDKIWTGQLDYEQGIKESFRYENVTKHENPLKESKRNSVGLPSGNVNIVTSRSHPSPKTKQWLNRFFKTKKTKIIQRGSSIKICLIAEGSAHVYPRFGRTCIWDTAAGQAILTSSGGFFTEIETFNELLYPGNIYNPPFLASSFKLG